jgi:hypothetical protein
MDMTAILALQKMANERKRPQQRGFSTISFSRC